MQANNNDTNDLEYLSQLGFEKIPVSAKELESLTKNIKASSAPGKGKLYYGLAGLTMGVCIGLSLFFFWPEKKTKTLPQQSRAADSSAVLSNANEPFVLDTINVVKENFIAQQPQATSHTHGNLRTPAIPQQADSVMNMPSQPVDMALFHNGPVQESKLKFYNNAPVVYIHDLKITNYTLLYFKNNRFVGRNERTGLSADQASWQRAEPDASHLKQSPDYFLHEELALALLYFKKANYDQCIQLLNSVAEHNDEDVNCDFYRGMCYYYKRNYAKAISLFDNCIGNRNNTFLQEASYYKAVALFDSGNREAALALFRQIAEEEGFYATKAKQYL